MSRLRVCFVGHSYHQKTGSSRFLSEILERHFDVSYVWDEGWLDKTRPLDMGLIDAQRPDLVLFWQELPRPKRLRRLQCRNWLWAPMHDSANYKRKRWRKYRGCRLRMLHFSAATRRFFDSLGYEGLDLRYFPPPRPERREDVEAPSLFFWLRRGVPGWPLLKTLLGEQRPARIVLRYAPDPGEAVERPSAVDIDEYHIDLYEGWMPQQDYQALLRTSQLFMAPRLAEGIGMAHLEAMATGLAVIAPDRPTMNEYLQNGQTGLLYDPDAPQVLDLANWAQIGDAARRSVEQGHRQWLDQEDSMIAFCAEPLRRRESWGWQLKRVLHV